MLNWSQGPTCCYSWGVYGKKVCHLQWCLVLELYFLENQHTGTAGIGSQEPYRWGWGLLPSLARRGRTIGWRRPANESYPRLFPYVQQNMKKAVAAVNEVKGNMAEEEKEFIDLRAPDGEEKTLWMWSLKRKTFSGVKWNRGGTWRSLRRGGKLRRLNKKSRRRLDSLEH